MSSRVNKRRVRQKRRVKQQYDEDGDRIVRGLRRAPRRAVDPAKREVTTFFKEKLPRMIRDHVVIAATGATEEDVVEARHAVRRDQVRERKKMERETPNNFIISQAVGDVLKYNEKHQKDQVIREVEATRREELRQADKMSSYYRHKGKKEKFAQEVEVFNEVQKLNEHEEKMNELNRFEPESLLNSLEHFNDVVMKEKKRDVKFYGEFIREIHSKAKQIRPWHQQWFATRQAWARFKKNGDKKQMLSQIKAGFQNTVEIEHAERVKKLKVANYNRRLERVLTQLPYLRQENQQKAAIIDRVLTLGRAKQRLFEIRRAAGRQRFAQISKHDTNRAQQHFAQVFDAFLWSNPRVILPALTLAASQVSDLFQVRHRDDDDDDDDATSQRSMQNIIYTSDTWAMSHDASAFLSSNSASSRFRATPSNDRTPESLNGSPVAEIPNSRHPDHRAAMARHSEETFSQLVQEEYTAMLRNAGLNQPTEQPTADDDSADPRTTPSRRLHPVLKFSTHEWRRTLEDVFETPFARVFHTKRPYTITHDVEMQLHDGGVTAHGSHLTDLPKDLLPIIQRAYHDFITPYLCLPHASQSQSTSTTDETDVSTPRPRFESATTFYPIISHNTVRGVVRCGHYLPLLSPPSPSSSETKAAPTAAQTASHIFSHASIGEIHFLLNMCSRIALYTNVPTSSTSPSLRIYQQQFSSWLQRAASATYQAFIPPTMPQISTLPQSRQHDVEPNPTRSMFTAAASALASSLASFVSSLPAPSLASSFRLFSARHLPQSFTLIPSPGHWRALHSMHQTHASTDINTLNFHPNAVVFRTSRATHYDPANQTLRSPTQEVFAADQTLWRSIAYLDHLGAEARRLLSSPIPALPALRSIAPIAAMFRLQPFSLPCGVPALQKTHFDAAQSLLSRTIMSPTTAAVQLYSFFRAVSFPTSVQFEPSELVDQSSSSTASKPFRDELVPSDIETRRSRRSRQQRFRLDAPSRLSPAMLQQAFTRAVPTYFTQHSPQTLVQHAQALHLQLRSQLQSSEQPDIDSSNISPLHKRSFWVEQQLQHSRHDSKRQHRVSSGQRGRLTPPTERGSTPSLAIEHVTTSESPDANAQPHLLTLSQRLEQLRVRRATSQYTAQVSAFSTRMFRVRQHLDDITHYIISNDAGSSTPLIRHILELPFVDTVRTKQFWFHRSSAQQLSLSQNSPSSTLSSSSMLLTPLHYQSFLTRDYAAGGGSSQPVPNRSLTAAHSTALQRLSTWFQRITESSWFSRAVAQDFLASKTPLENALLQSFLERAYPNSFRSEMISAPSSSSSTSSQLPRRDMVPPQQRNDTQASNSNSSLLPSQLTTASKSLIHNIQTLLSFAWKHPITQAAISQLSPSNTSKQASAQQHRSIFPTQLPHHLVSAFSPMYDSQLRMFQMGTVHSHWVHFPAQHISAFNASNLDDINSLKSQHDTHQQVDSLSSVVVSPSSHFTQHRFYITAPYNGDAAHALSHITHQLQHLCHKYTLKSQHTPPLEHFASQTQPIRRNSTHADFAARNSQIYSIKGGVLVAEIDIASHIHSTGFDSPATMVASLQRMTSDISRRLGHFQRDFMTLMSLPQHPVVATWTAALSPRRELSNPAFLEWHSSHVAYATTVSHILDYLQQQANSSVIQGLSGHIHQALRAHPTLLPLLYSDFHHHYQQQQQQQPRQNQSELASNRHVIDSYLNATQNKMTPSQQQAISQLLHFHSCFDFSTSSLPSALFPSQTSSLSSNDPSRTISLRLSPQRLAHLGYNVPNLPSYMLEFHLTQSFGAMQTVSTPSYGDANRNHLPRQSIASFDIPTSSLRQPRQMPNSNQLVSNNTSNTSPSISQSHQTIINNASNDISNINQVFADDKRQQLTRHLRQFNTAELHHIASQFESTPMQSRNSSSPQSLLPAQPAAANQEQLLSWAQTISSPQHTHWHRIQPVFDPELQHVPMNAMNSSLTTPLSPSHLNDSIATIAQHNLTTIPFANRAEGYATQRQHLSRIMSHIELKRVMSETSNTSSFAHISPSSPLTELYIGGPETPQGYYNMIHHNSSIIGIISRQLQPDTNSPQLPSPTQSQQSASSPSASSDQTWLVYDPAGLDKSELHRIASSWSAVHASSPQQSDMTASVDTSHHKSSTNTPSPLSLQHYNPSLLSRRGFILPLNNDNAFGSARAVVNPQKHGSSLSNPTRVGSNQAAVVTKKVKFAPTIASFLASSHATADVLMVHLPNNDLENDTAATMPSSTSPPSLQPSHVLFDVNGQPKYHALVLPSAVKSPSHSQTSHVAHQFAQMAHHDLTTVRSLAEHDVITLQDVHEPSSSSSSLPQSLQRFASLVTPNPAALFSAIHSLLRTRQQQQSAQSSQTTPLPFSSDQFNSSFKHEIGQFESYDRILTLDTIQREISRTKLPASAVLEQFTQHTSIIASWLRGARPDLSDGQSIDQLSTAAAPPLAWTNTNNTSDYHQLVSQHKRLLQSQFPAREGGTFALAQPSLLTAILHEYLPRSLLAETLHEQRQQHQTALQQQQQQQQHTLQSPSGQAKLHKPSQYSNILHQIATTTLQHSSSFKNQGPASQSKTQPHATSGSTLTGTTHSDLQLASDYLLEASSVFIASKFIQKHGLSAHPLAVLDFLSEYIDHAQRTAPIE